MANIKGGALTQTAQPRTLKDLITNMQGEIKKALPHVMTPERFSRMVLTALSSNPMLQDCTPKSFLAAMMQAAQLGVEPNTPLGQAYLIPYRNHGTLECQFQLGYKGLIDLAYRSGEITDISAQAVYENDIFEYEFGLQPKLRHIPALADRGAVVLYYAVYHTKSGGYGFDVMSFADIQAHAKRFSKAAGKGFSPWQSDFDAMAKKTVLKRLLKYAPIKTEFQRGLSTDETIKTDLDIEMQSQPDTTVYDEPEPDVEAEQETEAEVREPIVLDEGVRE